jgi:hypothetical protein
LLTIIPLKKNKKKPKRGKKKKKKKSSGMDWQIQERNSRETDSSAGLCQPLYDRRSSDESSITQRRCERDVQRIEKDVVVSSAVQQSHS